MPPADNRSPSIAREYLRVSRDNTGRLKSPAEQHTENSRAAAAEGWTLGEPYAEAGAVSASRYSTRVREAFDALTRDLKTGSFAADVLILWESSRGSRDMGEWVGLIDALAGARLLVHVTSHDRTYNPRLPRDRKSLMDDVVAAEYEAGQLSNRVTRSNAASAAAGQAFGRIPYGYMRTYDPRTRELISQDPDPVEAPVVAELYSRLLAGDSFGEIARDFEARGIRTRGSAKWPPRPFRAAHLRDMALRPCYAGLRVYQPKEAGRWRPGTITGAVPAVWAPLVAAETWHEVYAMLQDPARTTRRPGGTKHLLSLIAVCGVCGGALTAFYLRDGRGAEHRRYRCYGTGCVFAAADDLDAVAEAVMKAWLSRAENLAWLRGGDDPEPELVKARAEFAAARAELADWRARASRREVSAASFAAIEPGILGSVQALEAKVRGLETPHRLARLIAPREQVDAWWDDATLPVRREVARMLLSPGIIGRLALDRDPVRGRSTRRGPVTDRIRWVRDGH